MPSQKVEVELPRIWTQGPECESGWTRGCPSDVMGGWCGCVRMRGATNIKWGIIRWDPVFLDEAEEQVEGVI